MDIAWTLQSGMFARHSSPIVGSTTSCSSGRYLIQKTRSLHFCRRSYHFSFLRYHFTCLITLLIHIECKPLRPYSGLWLWCVLGEAPRVIGGENACGPPPLRRAAARRGRAGRPWWSRSPSVCPSVGPFRRLGGTPSGFLSPKSASASLLFRFRPGRAGSASARADFSLSLSLSLQGKADSTAECPEQVNRLPIFPAKTTWVTNSASERVARARETRLALHRTHLPWRTVCME